MGQRSKPMIDNEDITKAVDELYAVLNIDSLSDVDKFFALNLLDDYGKICGITEAAWRSIERDGLTKREDSGGKGNRHYRMVKSEAIDIFKSGVASKLALAAKISKFVSTGMAQEIAEESKDEFDDFE